MASPSSASTLYVILVTTITVSGYLITTPENDALYAGPPLILFCQATNSSPGGVPRVQWYEHITSADSSGIQISDNDVILGHPNAARYSIVNVTGGQYSYDLQIDPTVMADGGMYQCRDTHDGSQIRYAQVTMLGASPNCVSTIPEDGYVRESVYYTIECTLNYDGQYVPKAWWTFPETFQQTTTTTNDTVWTGASVTMTRYMDYKRFELLYNFTEQMFVMGTATNIPQWNYSYESPLLYVQWAPTNLYIVPVQESYEIGQTIECHADANPDATFFLQNIDTLQRWDTFTLTATQAMVGYNRMRCNAANNITGTTYTNDLFFNFTVNPITTTPIPTTTTPAPTPPAEEPCDDLSGRWATYDPHFIDMCLEINNTNSGRVVGILRNATDPYFVEVRGRIIPHQYNQIGFTGIWPEDIGTLTFVGICRKCVGVEKFQLTGVSRNVTNNPTCSDHGPCHYYGNYLFERTGTTCRGLLQQHLPGYRI